MDKKNSTLVIGVILFAAGALFGYVVFGNRAPQMPYNMHSMSDGSMMQNDSMDYMMNGMMMGLSGKTGDEFDRAFVSEMIMHHQGAVAMAEAVLQNSKRPELINLANEIISAQTKEIEMMQGWQRDWFGQ